MLIQKRSKDIAICRREPPQQRAFRIGACCSPVLRISAVNCAQAAGWSVVASVGAARGTTSVFLDFGFAFIVWYSLHYLSAPALLSSPFPTGSQLCAFQGDDAQQQCNSPWLIPFVFLPARLDMRLTVVQCRFASYHMMRDINGNSESHLLILAVARPLILRLLRSIKFYSLLLPSVALYHDASSTSCNSHHVGVDSHCGKRMVPVKVPHVS